MVTTIVRLREKVSRRGISVTPPTISSRHDTGLARSCGLARVEVLRAVPKEEGESINLEVMKGLGDAVEKVTKATGVKYVVDRVSKATGKDCGCGQRKDSLNRQFPFGK
tara:strand:- start:782 stop:1108 length:327 start_codon:yes stop_codon:yes gene_type:complete